MKKQAIQILAGVFLALTPLGLSSCATGDTVASAPITAGEMREFSAPYEQVTAAALEAVERLNVDVQGSDENAQRFQIRFSKPVSAFSWGEVGVVNIIRAGDGARVYVNSEKRHQGQISGTSERRFAEEIFANIDESLARLQQ